MIQGEAKFIAREIRTRCLHSSWSDLVGFWEGVIGKLEDAYRAVVQSTASSRVPARDSADMQSMVKDKLAMALSQLAGERQVAKLDAEATQWNQTVAGESGPDK